MTYPQHRLALAIALVIFAGQAKAASATVSTATTGQQVLTGADHLTVSNTGSVVYNASKAISLDGATSGAGVIVDNAGLIRSVTGRAIDTSGSTSTVRNYTLNNLAGGTIKGADDAVRLDKNFSSGSLVLNNAGLITSATGQALDFDAVQVGGMHITLNNYASGIIHSDGNDGAKSGANATVNNWGEISSTAGGDGIKPGSNSVVNNWGTITSGNAIDDDAKNDGIDIDESTGVTVNNYGTISGGRHGITTDTGATLYNYQGGTITGRNGSGFGSDGDGTVYNWGTITGAYAGIKNNGDGDGVDIDNIAHIENYGIIQGTGAHGVDKNGFANGSEGIALGGGYVYNASGALISGQDNAILVDDGSGGSGLAATTLINHGTIRGLNGFGIDLVGTFNDSVTNSGLISGSNGLALAMGGGDDTLVVQTGGRFEGLVDGGSGRDQLILEGNGTFGASQNFEWLQVNQGRWTLTGSGDFSEGGAIASGATLINQGGVAGTLTVDSGGVYAGGGSVGSLIVNGTLLTNSTLGTATISRDLTLNPDATLAYGVNADGTSAPLRIAGTATLNGATLAVQPSAGEYPWLNHYTVLQAGAVSGTFGKVTSDYAFLTPTLTYTATQVNLDYARNDVAFASYAGNSSARSAAGSISQLGRGNALYNAVLNTTAATAGSAITQLSGATTASLSAATQAGSAQVGSSMLAAMQSMGSNGALMVGLNDSLDDKSAPTLADTGVPASARNLNDPNAQGRLWLQGLSSYGKLDGSNGSSALDQRTHGAVLGADWAMRSDWRLGVLGGYSKTDLDASGLSGDIDSWHVGVYAQHQSGPLAVRLGAAYSGHDGSSKRQVSFSGFNDTPRGDYHANSQQAFAELGYALGSGRLNLEPFANLGYQRYHRNSYQEKGGAAALDVDAQTQDNVTSTLGLRFAHLSQLDNGVSLTPWGSLGWRHTYGDVDSSTKQAFLAGGSAFSVQGTALDRDSLVVEAGLDVGFTAKQSLGLGYSGELGSNSRNHAVIGQWQMKF